MTFSSLPYAERGQDRGDDGRRKRRAISSFVRDFWLAHGYGPDVRTITRDLGLSSTSVADYHIAILVRRGALVQESRQARTLRPANWREYLK